MPGRSLALLAAVALIALAVGWFALRTPAVPPPAELPTDTSTTLASSAPLDALLTPDTGTIRVEEAPAQEKPVDAIRTAELTPEFMRNLQRLPIDSYEMIAEPLGTSVVRGTVRSSAPIVGARILFASPERRRVPGDRNLVATTDASGQYELAVPAPATYTLHLESNGVAPQSKTVTLAAAVDAVVDFELPASGISGRVLGPNGLPVKYVRVQLSADGPETVSHVIGSLSAWTDDSGRFAFEGVDPGKYRLATDVMSMAGERYVRNAVPIVALRGIEVSDTSSVAGLEIRLTAGATVFVQVLSPDGSPASGATVGWLQDFGVLGQATADSAGVARLEGLAPGETRLFARASSGTMRTGHTFDLHARAVVETTIRLQPGTLLSVRLEDVNGKLLTNGWGHSVTVRDATDRDGCSLTSPFVQAEGGRFGPLPEGDYEVHVRFRSEREVQQTVYVSGKEQQLVVREPD